MNLRKNILSLEKRKKKIISVPFRLFLYLLLWSIGLSVSAQEENKLKIEKCARLQSGIIMMVNSEDQYLKPGMNIQYCYGIKTGNKLGAGFGAGFQYFKDELFVPFLIDMIWFAGKNSNCNFISLNGGYSLGWKEKYKEYITSDFSGGPALGAGFGRKFLIRDQYAFFLNAGYQYQNAGLSYKSDNETYHKSIHYHMFIINFGLMLQQ